MTFDARKLRSQRLRDVNFQGDALRMGMNWTEEDLAKPQILVDSAYGMGHPGTFHFRPLIEEISNGVFEAGGKPAVFAASDICDGVAQATSGMSYSLVSRDVMAAMVEIHVSRGEKPHEELVERQKNACPTCGACQFMGSASTGQVLAEALGLALPGSALIPAPLSMLMRYA